MKKTDFLVLTDHRGHSDQNSIYALVRTLAADARTGNLYVVSRSDTRNTAFFGGDLAAQLYGLRAGADFAYDASGRQFTEGRETTTLFAAAAVWLRLPPPADEGFFAHLAAAAPASAPKKKPLLFNDPRGILETGSKAFLLNFPEFTAPVRRMQTLDDVRQFKSLHPIVLKPLQEYGGRGLVKISHELAEADGIELPLEDWLESARDTIEAGGYLGMKFLPNVAQGDKRILVVNGQILGASLRLPAPGQWLCNVAQGGTSVPASVTPEEEAMIATISPTLLKQGVVIFGADTLVDDSGKRVLSELNTNSIGGFPQTEKQTGRPILQQTINGIYDYLRRYL